MKIGIDLGGSKIAAGAVNASGDILEMCIRDRVWHTYSRRCYRR